MSSIAQKLCEEIYEETSIKQYKHTQDGKKTCHPSRGKYIGQPTTSIVIEKRKEINKLLPKITPYKSRTVINKFKSKETILNKRFVDIALNTTVTGPLKCDNDCVTMVRKRENYIPKCCKCGNKRVKCNTSSKENQTLDFKCYPVLDKACARNIDTVHCGTQLLENLSGTNRSPTDKTKSNVADIYVQTSVYKRDSIKLTHDTWRNKGARRWALSQGPTRGPDF